MNKFFSALIAVSLSAIAYGQYVPPKQADVQARLAEWQDLKF